MHTNKIPLDILRIVFELALDKFDQGLSIYTIASDERTRATLCSVCRFWRTVALQDPLLWNMIYFVESESALHRVERNIRLSGTVPLDICMIPPRKEESVSYYGRFMDLIEPQSYRWRTLEVQNSSWARRVNPLWNGKTPILERLVISGWDRECSVALPLPQLGPGVTFLSISEFPMCWDKWSCTSITHLTLGLFTRPFRGPSTKSFYDLLSTVANRLSSLTLEHEWHITHEDVLPDGYIVLKALKSLNIRVFWTRQIQRLLERCRFPKLVNLDTGVSLRDSFSPSFVRLLSEEPKLFQSVKRLIITDLLEAIPFTEKSCIDALQYAFPNVEHAGLDSHVHLYLSEANLLLTSWGFLTQINIRRARLSEIREVLSRRLLMYATPLRQMNIARVNGTLYREDYEWICSHVDLFIIQGVQIDSSFSKFGEDVISLEERNEK